MRKGASNPGKVVRLILIVIVPIFIYFFILISKIPYTISYFFSNYSLLSFILILGLFAGSYYIKGWKGWLIGLSLTMGLFAFSLSYKWASGTSSATMIGGLLPYKDAYFYYGAARSIVSGHLIPSSNPASWHPLFSGFLAIVFLVTNSNLQISLAIITGVAALACYLASRPVYHTLGVTPAAIFMTLLLLYAPVGNLCTELLGLAFGCLALFLLWHAAQNLKISYLIPGLIVLVTALSIRPGTFFVLPVLIVWAGYAFRGKKRYSLKIAGIVLGVILATLLVTSGLFHKLVAEAGQAVFGNFAYSFYGQVMGGTGWSRAVQDMGAADSREILRTALQVLFHHPLSFVIASIKSYRDFFLPGVFGVFSFVPDYGVRWWDILIWIAGLVFLVWGIFRTIRQPTTPLNSLLLSFSIGFVLSIPFLPPIDGGNRFYASTIAFLFALVVLGYRDLLPGKKQPVSQGHPALPKGVLVTSIFLTSIILIVPPIILRVTHEPTFTIPSCPAGQESFATQVNTGSYIDLIPAGNACGLAPNICIGDFKANGVERSVDDFYRTLVDLSQESETNQRIFPASNLIDGAMHFFLGDSTILEGNGSDQLVTGCAVEIRTQYQSIYKVQSVNMPTP